MDSRPATQSFCAGSLDRCSYGSDFWFRYRFVRYPIYTGILTLCLGTALDLGRLRCWLAFLLMAATFWFKLKQEERLLLRHFPDEFPVYQEQVKALVK